MYQMNTAYVARHYNSLNLVLMPNTRMATVTMTL
jgi:hypothetical protein